MPPKIPNPRLVLDALRAARIARDQDELRAVQADLARRIAEHSRRLDAHCARVNALAAQVAGNGLSLAARIQRATDLLADGGQLGVAVGEPTSLPLQ
jgi:hypothetical protein